MKRASLLAELEAMTHSARMRRMVDVGRAALGNSAVKAMLDEMERGGFHERGLSLQSCYGSRDGGRVLHALSDPSRLLRGLAIRLVALACDFDQALQAFSLLTNRAARKTLIRRLSRHRRFDVVDECLRRMMAERDSDAVGLVSYGSAAFVEQQLASHWQTEAGPLEWVRLARFHPQATADALTRIATSKTERDGSFREVVQAGIHSDLVERLPHLALELATLWLRHFTPFEIRFQPLVQRLPNEMAKLVLSRAEPFRVNFACVAERLEPGLLHDLLAHRPDVIPLGHRWFHRRPPAERRSLYEEFHHGWRNLSGCLPNWLIAVLPREQRLTEARAHWRHAPLATRPAMRLPFAGCLPWNEAHEALDPFIRNPDAELRAPAIAALVETVRFDRECVGELLPFAAARRYEQDPVRLAMLSAIVELPAVLWRPEHLEPLGLLIRHALDATDISHATAGSIERMIVKLLPRHPEWSASWLATLVKERGHISISSLEASLTDDDTRRVAPALLPVFKSWDTRERQNELLSAASSFRRRLKVFPELVTLIEKLAIYATQHVAWYALSILKTNVRASFRQLVPRLVASDPSWMTQSDVYEHVHRHRQDLLTPFLGRQAYRGRFSTGKTRFVLPVASGFHRWTPSQQAAFRTTLEEVTRDEQRDSPALLQVIRQLGALPEEVSPRLINLADVRNEKLITRDTALRVLGRMDAGQGVQYLLAALEDERSRIAIYALRQALLEMPAARAIAVLQGVAVEKVTVAKEVVRLLGELRTEASFRELLVWKDRPLHRDVRIALLRALWDYLDRDEAWSILDEAARSEDVAVATMAGRTPAARLSGESQERLISILLSVLSHLDPKVRCDVLARCQTLPVIDPQHRMLPSLVKAMSSPVIDEVQAAAPAVFCTYDDTHAAAIAGAVSDLLPNRRALKIVVAALEDRAGQSRSAMQPIVDQVLDALSHDPLTITLRVHLATAACSGAQVVAYLQQYLDDIHPEALMVAVQSLSEENSHGFMSGNSTIAEAVEAGLRDHPDARLRRVGLAALIAQSRSGRGWTAALRQRLTEYQRDSSSLVASAAAFTFPEDVPE